jgi:hypothetical protein
MSRKISKRVTNLWKVLMAEGQLLTFAVPVVVFGSRHDQDSHEMGTTLIRQVASDIPLERGASLVPRLYSPFFSHPMSMRVWVVRPGLDMVKFSLLLRFQDRCVEHRIES